MKLCLICGALCAAKVDACQLCGECSFGAKPVAPPKIEKTAPFYASTSPSATSDAPEAAPKSRRGR